MTNTITVDIDEINGLAKKGKDLVFKRDAENYLLTLLQLRDLIDEKVSEVKESIKETGQQLDPSFKGVVGKSVKAVLKASGEKYTFDERLIDHCREFLKVVHKVDSALVDKFYEETGTIPDGITQKVRKESISFIVNPNDKTTPQLLTPQTLESGQNG